jgi:tetratricopeptide (TPR) repeat protein
MARRDWADSLQAIGDLEGATAQLRMLVGAIDGIWGRVHSNTLSTRFQLARVLAAQEQFEESSDLYRSIMADGAELEEMKLTTDTLCSTGLGEIAFELGRLEEAERYFEQAWELRVEEEGEDDYRTWKAALEVARTRTARGATGAAEPLIQQAITRLSEQLGDRHDTVTHARVILGRNQLAQGRYDEAEVTLRGCFEKRTRDLGPEHVETLAAQTALGEALLESGRADDAEPVLRDAVRRSHEAWPRDPRTVARRQVALSRCLRASGRPREAEELLAEAHERYRLEHGEDSPACRAVGRGLAEFDREE